MRLSLTDVLLWPVERPACAGCRSSMNLSVITPSSSCCEKRLFECPKCGLTETQIVSDPINSGREFAQIIKHEPVQGAPHRH